MGAGQLEQGWRDEELRGQLAAAPAAGAPWTRLLPVLIVVAGLWAYHNSFAGAFLLDDEHAIVHSKEVRQLGPISVATLLAGRSLVTLSLQVNHALGGLDPWGYHLVNLVIHLLAALALYGVVRRTLLLDRLRARYQHGATWIALAAALLWVVHPLQTESVTYVIQRAESLMGLFYLLTVYCVVRGMGSAWGKWWYAAAVIFCALGMLSKEVMCTAPVLVLLYDRVFLAPSWGQLVRRRWGLYLGLACTWAALAKTAVWVLGSNAPAGTEEAVGFGVKGVTPAAYALSQPGVILHYLRLAFWPDPLCLDYRWAATRTTGDIILPAVAVAALLVATLWALWHRPALGYWGAWFFLILAPTSSIVPLKDLAFEHRMYLPLAAVLVLVVLAGAALWDSASRRLTLGGRPRAVFAAGLILVPVVLLAVWTTRRNEDYRSPLVMWADVVRKRPTNARGQYNLGHALYRDGRVAESVAHFREAVRLEPSFAPAHLNLGNALLAQGQPEEAAGHFREAFRLEPSYAFAHYNLANVLVGQGKVDEAVGHYRQAVRLDPNFPEAHNNLGRALALGGKSAEAVGHYQQALRLDPKFVLAHANLGDALLSQARAAEAVIEYREALRLDRDFAPGHGKLGSAFLMLGAWGEAAACFRRAVALRPREAASHRNLAFALGKQGRADEARAEYRVSLSLDLDWPRDSLRQAWELATHPDPLRRNGPLAVQTAAQVLEAAGDGDAAALDTLAAAYAELGRFGEAAVSARRARQRAREARQDDLANDIEGRLILYEKGQPFRTLNPR
jgi:tetratricopeptide (TPR) repeat protein